MKAYVLFSVRIDDVTMEETLNIIEGFTKTRRPHHIVTPNVDYVVQAQTNVALRNIINDADLSIPDGYWIVWAGRRIGLDFREHVPGRLILPRLAGIAERKGYKIYFLGGGEGVAERAAKVMKLRHGFLKISGVQHGFFKNDDEEEVVRKIRECGADILFVGMGTPKQELFVSRWKEQLGVSVAIGVGSCFDRISGRIKEPPLWVNAWGFEWLYRLLQEPSRIGRRLLRDLPFFSLVGREIWLRKFGGGL